MSLKTELKGLDNRARGKLRSLNTRGVGAIKNQELLIERLTIRIREVLQDRSNLARPDLEYLVEQTAKLKDERLKACIAELIGWGDDERADLETFCAVAIEVMKRSTPSKIREAAALVELRYHLKQGEDDASDAGRQG